MTSKFVFWGLKYANRNFENCSDTLDLHRAPADYCVLPGIATTLLLLLLCYYYVLRSTYYCTTHYVTRNLRKS
jgi:hypothetical protein